MPGNIKNVTAAIDYIESHLHEKHSVKKCCTNLKSLGFAEAELLVEFGYPTQKFILKKSKSGFSSQALRKEETEGMEHSC